MSIANQMDENRKIAEQEIPLKLEDDYNNLLDQAYDVPPGTHAMQAGFAKRAHSDSTK